MNTEIKLNYWTECSKLSGVVYISLAFIAWFHSKVPLCTHFMKYVCCFFSTGEPWQQGGAKGHPRGRRHLIHQRTAHSQHQQQRRSCSLTERRPNSSSGSQRVSRKCLYINARNYHLYTFHCVVSPDVVMNVAVDSLDDCVAIRCRGVATMSSTALVFSQPHV
jgi:hypothetical protein